MTDTDRDTHFAGFARLLFQDWLDTCGGHIDCDSDEPLAQGEFEAFIAPRLYDLAIHVVTHSPPADLNIYHRVGGTKEWPWEQFFAHVPDLTEWPTQDEERILATDLSEYPEPE